MSVDTNWVRYGRPAAEALRSTISRAKGDEPLAPVTVVVPSNYVGCASTAANAHAAMGGLTEDQPIGWFSFKNAAKSGTVKSICPRRGLQIRPFWMRESRCMEARR